MAPSAAEVIEQRGRGVAPALAVVTLSFVARLLAWWWVVDHGVPPLFDEIGYWQRAEGWAEILRGWASFEAPRQEALAAAYGKGRWPPLHPMVLGLFSSLGGGLALARFVGVVLSTLTTLLVYRLGLRLANSRVAFLAALLHALTPTWVAYSHWLWAENLAIALALGGVLCILGIAQRSGSYSELGPRDELNVGTALLAGLLLGAAALTRVALLPWALVLPAWLAVSGIAEGRRRRVKAAALCLMVSLTVIAPWQLMLRKQESRWLLLSTLGGYNFALGNHSNVPDLYGSSWGHEASKWKLHRELREEGQRLGVAWEQTAAAVAWRQIQTRPFAAVKRGATRLRLLWAPDVFPLRHLWNAVYPPLPSAVALTITVLVLGFHTILVMAAVAGLVLGGWRYRSLLLLLGAAAMAPSAVTLALTRLQLPIETLLLPVAAGALLAGWRQEVTRGRRIAASVAALLAAAMTLTTLPRVLELYWIPSSHYAPVLSPLAGAIGASPLYSDRLLLSRESKATEELEVILISPGARFGMTPGIFGMEMPVDDPSARRWRWPGSQPTLGLEIISTGEAPIVLEIRLVTGGDQVQLKPVDRSAWHQPSILDFPTAKATPEAKVQVTWLGGGSSPG